jgi:hypothetical protein
MQSCYNSNSSHRLATKRNSVRPCRNFQNLFYESYDEYHVSALAKS